MAETFGRTVKGDTEETWMIGGHIYACKYQSGSAGSIASLSFYVKQQPGHTPNIKCCICDSSKNILANGTTEEKAVPESQDGWMVFDFVGTKPSVLAATDYWLAAWWDDGADKYIQKYYSAGSTDQTGRDTQVYGVWPDPLVTTSYDDREQSIYATYEEVAAKKSLVQAALISIPPLIVLPTLVEILRLTGGC